MVVLDNLIQVVERISDLQEHNILMTRGTRRNAGSRTMRAVMARPYTSDRTFFELQTCVADCCSQWQIRFRPIVA